MGTPCEIDVKLQKVEGRKSAQMKDRNGQTYKAPVFTVSDFRSRWQAGSGVVTRVGVCRMEKT